ncbi:MAG: DUF6660 family protein [Leeuwenhoekiella sp.]
MKFIALILSFYALALNVLPCNDTSAIVDSSQTEVTISSNMDHDHGNEADLCPPFCSCHCCHVHTIDFDVNEFEPLQPVISHKNFVHFDSLGKEIPHSFLQPPRV